MFIRFNGNPCSKNTGDCVVRAISIATGKAWYQVYAGLCVQGRIDCGFGNFNEVWSNYLLYLGFSRHGLPYNTRYTVGDFAADHPNGTYILGTGKHAVAVVDGDVVDSWDSRGEMLSDLRDMMRDAPDERMKSKIQRFISEIENS